jgi:hypothetical protein
MEEAMTHSSIKFTAVALLVATGALAPIFAGTKAEAKGAKEYFVNEYIFNQPMKGQEGFNGAYYCSYQTTPVEVALPNGKKKKVWKLTQACQ